MSLLEGLNYSNIINIDQVECWQHYEGLQEEYRNVHSNASSHTWAAAAATTVAGYSSVGGYLGT